MTTFFHAMRSGLAVAVLPLMGCLATHSTEALEVEATISSVTLGDDCMEAGLIGGGAGRCAMDAPCPSLCQQSSVQLHIVAAATGAEVPFEIVSIRVMQEGGSASTELFARNPRVFVDGYTTWDETIAPMEVLDVAYDTTAPDWAALSADSDDRFGWGTVYDVEIVVRIDGVERTLRGEAMREPEIAT